MRRLVYSLALSSLIVGCGTPPAPPTEPKVRPQPTGAPQAPPPSIPYLPSSEVLRIEGDEAPMFLARRGANAIFVAVNHGHITTRALGPDGAPTAEATEVAVAADGTQLVVVKAVGPGYAIAWVEPIAQNSAIKLLALDAQGKAVGAPALVAQPTEEVSWLELLPNARGALVAWEIKHPQESTVDAFVAAIGVKGDALTVLDHGNRVVEGALAWEAFASDRGAAIAIIEPSKAEAQKAKADTKKPGKQGKTKITIVPTRGELGRRGRVVLREIDPTGGASAPITVSDEATAQIDVNVVEIDKRWILSWTDEREIDGAVWLAAVEGGKVVVAPKRAMPPFGDQALVSIVAAPYSADTKRPGKRALLAWEEMNAAPASGRLIHLATVAPDLSLSKEKVTLRFDVKSGPPDIQADGEGFAIVTLAPGQLLDERGIDEEDVVRWRATPVVPAFVRLGGDLSVIGAEPVRAAAYADTAGVPYVVRGLSCGDSGCAAIASGAPQGNPISVVRLEPQKGLFVAAASRDTVQAPPRVSGAASIFEGEPIAKVAATELPNDAGTLAAWVTYYLDAPPPEAPKPVKGKKGDKQAVDRPAPRNEDGPFATLAVRPISKAGVPGATQILSRKAVSIGGVALAAAPMDKKIETAVAWVAKEKGEPHVFVTKLGPDGVKTAQKGVTVISRKKAPPGGIANEATNVAITYAPGDTGADGWVIAWSDTRDGNPEIYAARVDRTLKKIIPDRRLTDAAGDSSEPALALRGKEALLVWSDARGAADEGKADIWAVRIELATLKKLGPDMRLFASAAHSHAPQVAATDKGWVVGWIEDAEKKGGAGGLRIAEIDERGLVVGSPKLLAKDDTVFSSLALSCGAKGCKGAATMGLGDGAVLGLFSLPQNEIKTVAALTATGAIDASPVFSNGVGESLFFADDAARGSGRVRWLRLGW